MAYDASEILGSEQLAGARVLPKGSIMRHAWGPGGAGLAGGVAGAFVSATGSEVVGRKQKKEQAQADTPKIGSSVFLAATADELALIDIKAKGLTATLTDVIVRVPRSEVRSVEYHAGFISKLTVFFNDDSKWAFDIAKNGGKAAKGIVANFAS